MTLKTTQSHPKPWLPVHLPFSARALLKQLLTPGPVERTVESSPPATHLSTNRVWLPALLLLTPLFMHPATASELTPTQTAPSDSATVTQAVKLPKPFKAVYEAKYGGLSVTATRTLRSVDGNAMELRFLASSWLAKIEEVSTFTWGTEGQLIPQHYLYKRSGLGRDRNAELNFDWQTQKVVNNVQNKPWTMPVPSDAQDKLSYQLQLRHDVHNRKTDMNYQVADGGRIKHYQFEVQGEEVLTTPVGKLNTTRVKRIRDDNERVTILWLANDWDHLLIRIQQQEEDGKHYEINLASAELNGTPVKGF